MSSQILSAISPVVTGAGRGKHTTYTSTQVTGPIGNPPIYISEIIRYDDAKGSNPTTIGNRDPQTGKITWNENATGRTKQNASKFEKASTGQIKSVESGVAISAVQKNALNKSAGQGNTAQGSGDNESTPTTLSETPAAPKTRKNFGAALVFPEALSTIDRDIIKFNMMEYRPSGFGGGGSGGKIGTAGTRAKGKIIGTAILPIPAGITDTNSVGWGQDTMNPIQAAAANMALNTLQKGGEGLQESAEKSIDAITKGSPEIKKGLMATITGSATGLNQQVMQRGMGQVMNPNMELLFNGPALRSFGFSFKLSPRSPREAETVVKIIRFFKQGMSVIKSQSNFFLKAPHTFQLEYKHGGRSDHKYLNKFKECALQSCTVQYTPDGNYNTFTDGVMTSYSIQLGFNELEPIFNNDYDDPKFKIGRNEIGF